MAWRVSPTYSILEHDLKERKMERRANFTKIIDRVIDPDPRDDSLAMIYSKSNTTVTKVEDGEAYAVRVSPVAPPDHSIRMRILQDVGSLNGAVAVILHSEERAIGEQQGTIDVMPFLPGEPLDRLPSTNETLGIIRTMHALHRGLKTASPSFLDSGLPCLTDVLHGLLAASAPGKMKSRAEMLLADERFMQLLASEDRCLLYGDPWPSNFLIEPETDPIRVRIIDVDPIFIGPAILQPALLFSACFVAAHVLFSSEGSRPNLDALIDSWPEEIDRNDTIRMMRVYPILLSLVKLAEGAGTNPELLEANLRLLERCLEVVDTYE